MAFEGFKKEGQAFFRQLAVKQDRDWFKAHKDEYEELWDKPLKALFADLSGPVGKQYKGVTLAPAKIFRIYRDVRFSKDKSPFKTHAAAVLHARGGLEEGALAAIYIHLGMEEFAGAGHWMLTPAQLKRYRAIVADPKLGPELQRRCDALVKKGFELDSLESLKRVPPGFDPDHPRAELLKRKGLGFSFPKFPANVRYTPKFAKWLVEQSAIVAPTVVWLESKL